MRESIGAFASGYLGVSAQGWQLIFDGLQAISITAALAFGTYQLSELRRGRMAESLEKLHQKWIDVSAETMAIIYGFPILEGSTSERAVHFTGWVASCLAATEQGLPVSPKRHNECAVLLKAAREVVHVLSDLSAYMETSTVRERDFFRQYLGRMLEIYYLLEPYVILVSISRSFRWGLRIRRLGVGSVRYLITSKAYEEFRPKLRGVEIYDALIASIEDCPLGMRKSRLIPSENKCIARDKRTIEEVKSLVLSLPSWPSVAQALSSV